MCRSSRTVGAVQVEQGDAFLGTVQAETSTLIAGDDPWTITLSLNDSPVEFKIDTGADVSVIPEATFEKFRGITLTPASKSLSGPSQHPLHVCGQFKGTLKHEAEEVEEVIFVVRGLQKALMGRPAIEALGLVSRLNAINSREKFTAMYPDLFTGLGTLEGEYRIKLKEDAEPFALTTSRRVALPLMPKVKEELERMEKLGVITRVNEPTDWCAGMVVVPKPNGKVRICVDLTKLNESVCRERHILPSVEQILAQLGGATVFSKLDANSGFWQIKLTEESSTLTTFITPFGRFCFNRFPFGITSAPEHFQRRISDILTGLDGTVCMIDDVLVYGRSQEEHDRRLRAVLERIRQAGVTLNQEKCEFSTNNVKFLGQMVNNTGIRPDPEKVKAIQEMKAPTSITEVRRFLGMTNQLSKFSPNLAEKTKPLRDLLSKKNQWMWGASQQEAFDALKEELSSTPVLAHYDPERETTVSADASSYGLGAVLTQRQSDGSWRPVAYTSRALTDTEQRYAQIEKEALAATWACERFSDYLLGMQFHLETDHKPLVPLLGSKRLDDLPLRVQQFWMRLMRFTYTISHVPGKDLVTADALSRAPVTESNQDDDRLRDEVQVFVNFVIQNLPATDSRIQQIKKAQEKDTVCQAIKQYCEEGWPVRNLIKGTVKSYLPMAAELTVQEGLLMRGSRIVIPAALRLEILAKLHTGQGITKCRERARQSVWWPGLGKQLEEMILKCSVCCQDRFQYAEPLIPSSFPDLPWQKVATDLWYWKATYLLLVDYFSRYIEIAKLTKVTSNKLIHHIKSIFARHGIPQEVRSDNGPQYASSVFDKFAKEYVFLHVTSSPRYPQSNGEAERAVKTIKKLIKKAADPYLALLTYRSTPLQNGYSPAELLMNRRLRTRVPMVSSQLKSSIPDYASLRKKEQEMRRKQKSNFDSHHNARSLDILLPGEQVWVADQRTNATVEQQAAPRSYLVSTPRGTLRRNRRHLVRAPETDTSPEEPPEPDPSNSIATPTNSGASGATTTRSGRVSRPPNRMDPSWN